MKYELNLCLGFILIPKILHYADANIPTSRKHLKKSKTQMLLVPRDQIKDTQPAIYFRAASATEGQDGGTVSTLETLLQI